MKHSGSVSNSTGSPDTVDNISVSEVRSLQALNCWAIAPAEKESSFLLKYALVLHSYSLTLTISFCWSGGDVDACGLVMHSCPALKNASCQLWCCCYDASYLYPMWNSLCDGCLVKIFHHSHCSWRMKWMPNSATCWLPGPASYLGSGHLLAEILQLQFLNYCTSLCNWTCLLYTSPSPRDATLSRMPSSA